MNIPKEKITELNKLLSNININIPVFRRQIGANGSNYHWLQKNILTKNPSLDVRIKELLDIK